MHSLQRLKALFLPSGRLANAFMLVDMADGMADIDEDLPTTISILSKIPAFMTCNDANNQLITLVEASSPSCAVTTMMMDIFKQQTLYFCQFTRSSPFFSH